MRLVLPSLAVAVLLAGCSAPPPSPKPVTDPAAAEPAAAQAAARKAHGTYVAAINSNDVDTLMKVLTDDVVYQSPHEPEIVGKAAVRKWVEGYFGAYTTHWEKTSLEFVVSGDWAFERYAYKSTDTPKAGGAPSSDVGKGINIYHHDADGAWRVARDGWSTDLPLPK